ncbi:MAG: ATP-binding protein [Muribaculaceae bacterium]|nr:ATP-binding protein [Muribaculaceae bacterium]
MVILIGGASHTGKTALAQRLLERYKYPYLSIDHLKMGLIRSGYTHLTPESDDKTLTEYLWPVVREMIKTAIENKQHLIVEGCYIPFDWQTDFETGYLSDIRYLCLIFSEEYIRSHFESIRNYANVIECRIDDSDYILTTALHDNAYNLSMCRKYGLNYVLIEDEYSIDIKTLAPD